MLPRGKGTPLLSMLDCIRLRQGARMGWNKLVCPVFQGGPGSSRQFRSHFRAENEICLLCRQMHVNLNGLATAAWKAPGSSATGIYGFWRKINSQVSCKWQYGQSHGPGFHPLRLVQTIFRMQLKSTFEYLCFRCVWQNVSVAPALHRQDQPSPTV